MKTKLIAILLTAGSLALAGGPRGPQSDNTTRPGSGLDMTRVQTIEGPVLAINIGYGTQYPSVQINQTTIKVAPVWFLLDGDFEIKVGDKLRVTAAPSLQVKDPYLSAITLANTVSGASVTLRDANGIPLWAQAGSGQGDPERPGTCNGCGGPISVATMSGTVDQITAGVGIQMPTLVLKTSDGRILTLKIGPERMLEAADFEIKAGEALTVRYAVTCTGDTVALSLTNATGRTIVLRNEDGTPTWR